MLRRDVTRGVAGTILLKVGSGGLAFALFSLAARTMTPDAFGDFATLLSVAQIAAVAGLVGQELLLVRFLNEYEGRGQAEWTKGEANPRFIVTSLTAADGEGRFLYEAIYCARGEMENRIKECQLDLFADRTSTGTMQANQLRLWFASMAYVLLCALRRIGLAHTQFAEATCGTIRLKLLKLGALVRVSVRRIKIAMASACPWQDEFALAHVRLAIATA